MRAMIGGAIACWAAASAVNAENTYASYRFEDRSGVEVTCGIRRANDREQRFIIKARPSSVQSDYSPTAKEWAASGCEAFIKKQSQVIPMDEVRRRLRESQRPISFDELMCGSTPNMEGCEGVKWRLDMRAIATRAISAKVKTADVFVVGGDVFDDSQAYVTMCGSAKVNGEDGIFGLLIPSGASDFGAVQFAFFRDDATFEQWGCGRPNGLKF